MAELLTTTEFCKRYPFFTSDELTRRIRAGEIPAIRTLNAHKNKYKIYPPDVRSKLIELNSGHPAAIETINKIFSKVV